MRFYCDRRHLDQLRGRTPGAVICSLLFLALLNAQSVKNQPIRGVLKQAGPSLTQTSILHRSQVAANLDLVIAIASPRSLSSPIIWWGEKEKLGLFLQEQSNPHRVYTLALATGFAECAARILRATATDAVIQCTGEKSALYPNQKFVYDIRAKSLVSHFAYQPFSMRRILSKPGNGALIVGTDNTRQIAVDFQPSRNPEFRLLNHAEKVEPAAAFRSIKFGDFRLIQESRNSFGPRPLIVQSNGTKHPLPRPTYVQFAQSRPEEVKNGATSAVEFDDHIGPWTLEGNNLWFGKRFYDGEGTTGIGGFGYFDTTEKKYHLYAPPEIVDYSVSAIHVNEEAVWMALVHNGEYGGSSGGLLRFDRKSNAIRKFEMPDIGLQFMNIGETLLLATNSEIVVILKGQITKYFIDKTTDGRLIISQE